VLVVVVIVGVVAAIAAATLSEDRKPATRAPAHRRDPVPHPEPLREAPADPEPEPAWADDFEPAFGPAAAPAPVAVWTPAELDEPEDAAPWVHEVRTWSGRLRSAGLLGIAVAVLGAVSAATIGASLLVGYRFLDRALG
jgi:hypothetical protein